MGKLKLNVASWNYDRVAGLIDGSVSSHRIELEYRTMWAQEVFARMLKGREFDASELSFGAYVLSLLQEDPPFTAIPVFPSRMFRHCSIYVSKDSGIETPEDLKGKRVGVPEYRQTATVWIRGILEDHYGVDVNGLEYFTGPLEDDRKVKKYFHNLSGTDTTRLFRDISLTRIGDGKFLSEMIENSEIDALFSALDPSTFRNGKNVKRLFPDYRSEEIGYYRKTGIFPIMHILALRRDIYEEKPWIAKELYDMFLESKNRTVDELENISGMLPYSLPWMFHEMDEVTSIMGKDYWPYGYRDNENTVERFLEYMYRQGLTPELLKPEHLFAAETLST